MDRSNYQEWIGLLNQSISNLTQGVIPAVHVANRLGALLAPAEIRYVDAHLGSGRGEGSGLSGEVIVFTEDLVAVATLDGVGYLDGDWDEEVAAGSVSVVVVPRVGLARVLVHDGDTASGAANGGWSREWRTWPRGRRVALEYSGLEGPLVLPSARQLDAFNTFVPALMADLAGR